MDNKILRYAKLVIPWMVTAAIFIVLSKKVDFLGVIFTIKQCDMRLLMLAVAISLFSNIFIACRKYQLILNMLGVKLDLKNAILIKVGSLPLRFIMPLKSGEVIRTAYLKRRHDVSLTKGFGSLLLSYIIGVSGNMFLIIWGWIILKTDIYPWWVVVPFIVLMVLSIILKDGRKMAVRLANMSILLVFFEMLNTLIIFKSLGIIIPLTDAFCFVPISVLASQMPVSVLGLGMREGALVMFLSRFSTVEIICGAGLLVSFVNRLLMVFIGFFFLKPFMNNLMKSSHRENAE